MQYKRKRRQRVYTARNRQAGAVKGLVIAVFALSIALLIMSFWHSVSSPAGLTHMVAPSQMMTFARQI